ncbi:unnamed protein product, partial [Allacma fusca]
LLFTPLQRTLFGIVKSRELPSTPVSITRGQYI